MLTRLKTRIPDLVTPAHFVLENPDSALELRDHSEFEREWLRVFEALHASEIPEPAMRAVTEIERTAFETVYAVTQSSNFTEFAPAVSEDFGLFARAVHLDYHDPWLSGLFACYQRGVFPCGPIQPVNTRLSELLANAQPSPSPSAQISED